MLAGRALTILRSANFMTIEDMADRLGFTESQVAAIEEDKFVITLTALEKYAMIFDVTISDIMHFIELLCAHNMPEEEKKYWLKYHFDKLGKELKKVYKSWIDTKGARK